MSEGLARLCHLAFAGGRGASGRLLPRRALTTLALSIAGTLALSAGIAQAEVPKLISYGNFPAGASTIVGIAVDQSSGDVYDAGLIDFTTFGPSNVEKFDASGKLLSPPSPFGQGFYSGTAVNPTNGDVYVLGQSELFGSLSVYTYDPSSGAPLSSFQVPASNNFSGVLTAVQIATDSAGNVYVPVAPDNEVLEYSPSGTLLDTFAGSGSSALSGPTGVAVDSAGNVWIADAGDNRIEELSPAGAFIGEIKSEGVEAVGLDAHGNVFATVTNSVDFCGSLEPPCSHLVEYDSSGTQLADIGAGFGVTQQKLPSTLAVNGSNGRVYVTDGLKNLIWVYGPPTPPVIGDELASEVSTSEAKLGALVNPGGIETSYRFEYGATTAYGQTTPFPDGSVGEGLTARTVWAAASGLAPGATYHYRVIATNELGTAAGPDQTFTTETAGEAVCPNEQFREGFSAGLPDCRAYELVTPPSKTSTQPDTESLLPFAEYRDQNMAASDGNRMAYVAADVLTGSLSGGFNYVATRGPDGWASENVLPLESYTADRCVPFGSRITMYSSDLSKGVLFDGGHEHPVNGAPTLGGCGAEGVEVVSGEPLGVKNLLLRDNDSGTYQLVNLAPPGVTPADATFQGASANLSHVVFDERAQLTANAPGGGEDDLYEESGEAVRLVTVLPDGAPVVGALPASAPTREHAVSADGSHILFVAEGDLYARIDGASTIQLDASQVAGPGGGGRFWDASADGSRVFFTDERRLTVSSTATSGEPDLYECEIVEVEEAGQEKPKCDLSDLTVAKAGEHANVLSVSGVSKDGAYVYFTAKGVLSGSQANAEGETPQSGHTNQYVYHAGTVTFISMLDPADENLIYGSTLVSPNGLFFAFTSTRSLTGYDNAGHPEIFLYSVQSNRFGCASCNPSGEAPPPIETSGAAIALGKNDIAPHSLSDGGRVLFQTSDALLPIDTDGLVDVYEYESGQLHLISTGTSSSDSILLDASESGNDVFFLTRQKLVPEDTNAEALSIYDARVGGGFAAPSSPPPCVTADACRAAPSPQPSIFGSPSSATFSGAGNVGPPSVQAKAKLKSKPAKCKKGSVKKRGKCVKKPQKKAKKSAHANKKTGK
jgi:hypothetical protein